MLQCVAVCVLVLMCVAVFYSMLQGQGVRLMVSMGRMNPSAYMCVLCCSVLHCSAVCYSVLQCVAVWCSVVQCVAMPRSETVYVTRVRELAAYMCACCRSVLQCVDVCCSVLQRGAMSCSVLQCQGVIVLQCQGVIM